MNPHAAEGKKKQKIATDVAPTIHRDMFKSPNMKDTRHMPYPATHAASPNVEMIEFGQRQKKGHFKSQSKTLKEMNRIQTF